MTKRRTAPLASSPIVAMAERAVVAGAAEALPVYVNADGERICISTPGMDDVRMAGLLSLSIADIAAGVEE